MLKRGDIIHRKIKGIQIGEASPRRVQARGVAPRRVQARGAAPRGEWPFSIDVKGGELVTLM